MKKLLKITVLSGSVAAGGTQADDKITLHHLHYQENDDRVKVGDTVVGFEYNIGVDHTISGSLAYDSISGASPAWQTNTLYATHTDVEQRAEKTTAAQSLSPHTILAYDPNGRDYQVKNVHLTDIRKSADISWTSRDSERNELTFGINYSQESDYLSYGINAIYLLYADESRNRSYSYGVSVLQNESDVFGTAYKNKHTKSLRNYSIDIAVNQILSSSSFISASFYYNFDTGYLSNHYLTVLRGIDINDDGIVADNEIFLGSDSRPKQRDGGGFTINWVVGIGDKLTLHNLYRFYSDSWKINSHTLDLELNYQFNADLIVVLKGRGYSQTAAEFYKGGSSFAARFNHLEFASSDDRLSKFTALTLSLGLSWQLVNNWWLDLSLERYKQSNNFVAVSSVAGFSYHF